MITLIYLVILIIVIIISKLLLKTKYKPKFNISIEGNIGSGKSTILEELRKLKYCVECQKFLKISSLLKKFYDDKENRKSEDMYILQKSIYDIYKETWNTKYETQYEVRLLEGICSSVNVFSKRSFDKKEINEKDFINLNEKCNLKKDGIIPNLIIYLNCPPKVCKERIDKDREIEKGIDLKYLEEIDNYYNLFLNTTNIKVIKINTENIPIGIVIKNILLLLKNFIGWF